jgi:phospholipid-binding lipoprotein MlaA
MKAQLAMKTMCVLIAASCLGACTGQRVSVRATAPTPVAASAPAAPIGAIPPTPLAPDAAPNAESGAAVAAVLTPQDAPSMRTYDPWERLNRGTYRFNARFDEAIFFPVADTYKRVLPEPVRDGVHNFFGNLAEVDSIINYALQGRLGLGARSLGRFALNSTIGIAGIFDVAARLNLPRTPTGFGTTLAKWGMHPGPFLVIPLLGPSTLREGFGLLADYGTSYAIDTGGLYRSTDKSWVIGGANAVDQRANVDFRYYATGSAFEYETIRFLYMHKKLLEDEGLHADEPREQPVPGEPAGK